MIDEFHKLAATAAIKNILEGKHFSICELRAVLVITGGALNKKDEAAFTCLHCVNWADMSPELRQMTFDKIMEAVNAEPFFNLECLSAGMDERFPRLHGGETH